MASEAGGHGVGVGARRRRSLPFRATSGVTAALTLHFLCGQQLAHAASLDARAREARETAARNLGVPVGLLEDPTAWHAAEDAKVAARRQQSLALLRQFTHADEAEAKAKQVQEAAKAIEDSRPRARLDRAIARGLAGKESPQALKARLLEADASLGPAFGKAALKKPAPEAPPRVDVKPKPRPGFKAQPPRKGTLGALTPDLKHLYESVAGEGALAMRDDGSFLPAEEVAAHPAPLKLTSLSSFLPLPSLGALPPPAPDDVAETPETRRSPEVVALAASLGGKPLALYNWVHRNVAVEYYYGSKKGAAATLLEKAGNDFDTASLLVALLRASGVPARYEYGTVRLSEAQALSLTGAHTVADAAGLLAKTGPAVLSADGKSVEVERAWVRTYVNYGDYRGTGPGQGEKLWVRLDAGLKMTRWTQAVDLRGLVHFDFATYLAQPQKLTPQEAYEAQLLAAAKQRNLCNTLDDALSQPVSGDADLQLLPAEHPAPVLQSLLVFARPPATLRHSVEVTLDGQARTVELSQLQGLATTLEYPGTTPADVLALGAAGGDVTALRPWAVSVTPTLMAGGQALATFAPTTPGTAQALSIRVTVPGGSPAVGTHRLFAGVPYGLMVQAGVLAQGELDAADRAVSAAAQQAGAAVELTKARAWAALAYYARGQEAGSSRLFALNGYGALKDVLIGVAGRRLAVTSQLGLPVSLGWGPWYVDISRDSLSPLPKDGNTSMVAELTRLSGHHGSSLEAKTWERLLSSPAISSVRALQAAGQLGVPVYQLAPGNTANRANLTGYSQGSLDDVDSALAAGWAVTIPQHPLNLPNYVGVEGYILVNPVDGSGVYRIGELLNGGEDSGSPVTRAPPDPPPGCDACGVTGSRTDFANGRWRETYTDLTLPAIGLPIVLSRTYASRPTAATAFGTGWMHPCGVFLRAEVGGGYTYVMEDWREARFSPKAGGGYQVAPGWYFTLTDTAGGTHRLRAKEGLTWDFDAAGRLTAVTDTSGNATTLVYAGGQLTQVVDSGGQVALTLSYTGNYATAVTDRAGRVVRYAYTGNDLTQVTDALGAVEAFAYDANHNLIRHTDKRGFTTTEYYDALQRWVGFRDALGNESSASYDVINQRSAYVDRTGRTTLFEWGPSGELLAKADGVGNRTQYVRDANLNPTTITDGRGNPTSMTYDTNGNMLSRSMPDGRSEANTYDATFNKMLTHAETGLPAIGNTYDAQGRLRTATDGIGTTVYDYDVKGRLVAVTAPASAPATIGYDAKGNLTSIIDATGRPMTLGYDAAGHLTSITDGNHKTRTMVVNALGHLMSMTDALNHKTSFTYDEAGNRTATLDAVQHQSTMAYDGLGRLVTTTDASNVSRTTEYDAEGRVVATADGLHHRSTRRYDAAGRLASTVDALGYTSNVGYCADVGQVCAEVDALGHARLRTFDSMGRVVAEVDELNRPQTHAHDSGGRVHHEEGPMQVPTDYTFDYRGLLQMVTTPVVQVAYQYDARGNRTAVQAFNSTGVQTTSYTYDLANRLLTETNPLNKATTYTYDPAGNRATMLDPMGRTTTYGYDDNRRLTSVTFQDNTQYLYAYDELGRRTLEQSPTHLRTLAYDAVGRLASVNDVPLNATITYGYDADGRRTLVSERGVAREYQYDARGLPGRARLGTGGWLDIGHDALGRRSFVTRPNGVRTDWLYDDAGQVLAVLHTRSGRVLVGYTYEYDGHGLRVAKTREDGAQETYRYDAADRLTRVDYGPNRTVEYTLDAMGNRTSETETIRGPTTTVSTKATVSNAFNQLLSATPGYVGPSTPAPTTYAWDNNGNLQSETTGAAVTTYGWDMDNRLRSVGQLTAAHSYEYDANGLRTRKVEAGTETRFLLDRSSVLAEFDGTGSATNAYLANPEAVDDVYAFETHGAEYFILTDALSSIVAVTDSTGNVVQRNEYEVYGARSVTGTRLVAAGFTGRWHEAWGGIEHRNRQRATITGTWLQPDRMGFIDGPNVYDYVRSNPVAFADPNGLSLESVAWCFFKGFLAGAVIGLATVAFVALASLVLPVWVLTAALVVITIITSLVFLFDTFIEAVRKNWDAVAFNFGLLAGGIMTGAAFARGLNVMVTGDAVPPWSFWGETNQLYSPRMGTFTEWLSTGLTTGGYAFLAGTVPAGVVAPVTSCLSGCE